MALTSLYWSWRRCLWILLVFCLVLYSPSRYPQFYSTYLMIHLCMLIVKLQRLSGIFQYLQNFSTCATGPCWLSMYVTIHAYFWVVGLVLWCLMPLSTIFQLYRRSQFIGGGNRRTRRKPPTCRKSLTNFITMLYNISGDRHQLHR